MRIYHKPTSKLGPPALRLMSGPPELPLSLINQFIILYWHIVDLPYCIAFIGAAVIQLYICMSVHLLIFLFHCFHYTLSQDVEYSSLCYMVCPRSSILYSSSYMLIPNSKCIPPSISPLVTIHFCSLV
ncbi:unnamed protein product [Rangifer tarandus platyrhynchus]|uniref:Uncharacterized protein n=1 Tax=Rangifer tarandus platyrhynchus TaxID=3082113 RepID=A0AC59ZMD1_RANTA